MEFYEKAIDLSVEVLAPLAKQGECVVLCYNGAEVWQSRELAAEFYLEAMCACEGAERERYTNVLLDIMAGKTLCHDGVTQCLTHGPRYR